MDSMDAMDIIPHCRDGGAPRSPHASASQSLESNTSFPTVPKVLMVPAMDRET